MRARLWGGDKFLSLGALAWCVPPDKPKSNWGLQVVDRHHDRRRPNQTRIVDDVYTLAQRNQCAGFRIEPRHQPA